MSRAIKYRQPLLFEGNFRAWHYWGMLYDKFISPISVSEESYQFTGAHDKNGKEIYEGDIVKYEEDVSFDYDGGTHYEKAERVEQVIWCSDLLSYEPQVLTNVQRDCINIDDVEVIGNIFENPELLEKE